MNIAPKQIAPAPATGGTCNYNAIDLVKFFCALLVFFIHFPLFQGEVSQLEKYLNFGLRNYMARLAVPFYFVCSGFFLFRKMPAGQIHTETLKTYCFKILRLLGIWYVLLTVGGTYHLWYLGATVVATVFLSILLRHGVKYRYIFLLGMVFYMLGALGDAYYGVIRPYEEVTLVKFALKAYFALFQTTRNGIFMGFLFLSIGAAIAQKNITLKPWKAFLGFVLSMACLFAEVFWLKSHDYCKDYNMYMLLPLAVFFLFVFVCSIRLKDRPVYRHLRNIGMLVYFSHLMVTGIVVRGIKFVAKLAQVSLAGYTEYVVVFALACTVAFGAIINWLSGKEKFKWLKWCIS